jgi:hypothetical protein
MKILKKIINKMDNPYFKYDISKIESVNEVPLNINTLNIEVPLNKNINIIIKYY